MSRHPYRDLPPDQFWSTGVAAPLDPVRALPFTIAPTDPVAAAGACFAQHVGRHLKQSGYNYLVTEPPAAADEPVYSARFGNITTARQLRQLLLGAYGLHRPATRAWRRADGRFIDPLRPKMFPAGFATPAELFEARRTHLAATRRAFQESRVFIFTLGHTEAWLAADGTVLPVPPGVFDVPLPDGDVTFHNFSAAEIRQDLEQFLADLTEVNPKIRVILTVSPVPLAATYVPRHVLLSNSYSKAALRVAAEETAQAHRNVAYFPAYEILTAPGHHPAYLADDFRHVTEAGIAETMRLFTAHALRPATAPAPAPEPALTADVAPSEAARASYAALADIFGDETAFDPAAGEEAWYDLSAALPDPGTASAPAAASPPARIDPTEFLSPRELQVTTAPPARVLAMGSCLMEDLLAVPDSLNGTARFDFVLVNGPIDFPAAPPADIATYDYQLIQLPLRFIMPDAAFLHANYADLAQYETEFAESRKRLLRQIDFRLKWNTEHGILTFVMNFMLPQFTPIGRYQPRFDLRNIEYFVMRLNQELEHCLAARSNCYVLDVDRVAASLGRRRLQDDSLTGFNHNARMPAGLRALDRMEEIGPLESYYDLLPGAVFPNVLLAELDAMYRTLRQADSVKLVVLDLDDTLWNGVSGDTADIGPEMIEGWPVGIIETLQYLRQRGIVLAIASKNDESRIRAIWPKIFGNRLKLEDFGAVHINWRPKAENMQSILQAMNLLPRNVVFVDDNPAERAAMTAAFPGIRTLGRNPFTLRRALLLAPETQVVTITTESSRRTEMIQAQAQREAERAVLTPEEFARDQQVKVTVSHIKDVTDRKFPRAFELVNKTNQFNTTGKRWTEEECRRFFAAAGRFTIYEVEDRYTPYGLVGVVIIGGSTIVQWVMSCRVIGMGVEQAVMRAVVRTMRSDGETEIDAVLQKTEFNQPCQNLFAAAGFEESDGAWFLDADKLSPVPQFVTLEHE